MDGCDGIVADVVGEVPLSSDDRDTDEAALSASSSSIIISSPTRTCTSLDFGISSIVVLGGSVAASTSTSTSSAVVVLASALHLSDRAMVKTRTLTLHSFGSTENFR